MKGIESLLRSFIIWTQREKDLLMRWILLAVKIQRNRTCTNFKYLLCLKHFIEKHMFSISNFYQTWELRTAINIYRTLYISYSHFLIVIQCMHSIWIENTAFVKSRITEAEINGCLKRWLWGLSQKQCLSSHYAGPQRQRQMLVVQQ